MEDDWSRYVWASGWMTRFEIPIIDHGSSINALAYGKLDSDSKSLISGLELVEWETAFLWRDLDVLSKVVIEMKRDPKSSQPELVSHMFNSRRSLVEHIGRLLQLLQLTGVLQSLVENHADVVCWCDRTELTYAEIMLQEANETSRNFLKLETISHDNKVSIEETVAAAAIECRSPNELSSLRKRCLREIQRAAKGAIRHKVRLDVAESDHEWSQTFRNRKAAANACGVQEQTITRWKSEHEGKSRKVPGGWQVRKYCLRTSDQK